ncbi:antibiotic biosynthesis monooxygenase [Weissella cibaria]|uniref:antibiotic biosynthesis monooxygenase n=1 Tax=Weissella cibaria TaxID=137591 RepID=UPI0015F5DACD|nr:antibiotic biosynthesis monooxygenase [Weissella cibaria]MBA5962411.1 antibiotic biosynthesis monooxygenase [Weissella cibaria]
MTEYLHVTFGSRTVLQDVRNQHLDHKLLLTVDEEDKERYQLLEKTTNKKSIFAMPTTYEILAECGDTSDLRGWMNFTFITLNDMERDNFIRRYQAYEEGMTEPGFISSYLLQRNDNSHQIVMLSTWNMKTDWENWQAKEDFPLRQYESSNSLYGLMRKQYSFAAFSKQVF